MGYYPKDNLVGFIRPTFSDNVTRDTGSNWKNIAELKVGTKGSILQLTISDLIAVILSTS